MQTIVGKLREGLPRIAERGTAEKPQESAVMWTLYRLPDCLARFFAREGFARYFSLTEATRALCLVAMRSKSHESDVTKVRCRGIGVTESSHPQATHTSSISSCFVVVSCPKMRHECAVSKEKGVRLSPTPLFLLVGREGFEPSTYGLRVSILGIASDFSWSSVTYCTNGPFQKAIKSYSLTPHLISPSFRSITP